MPIGHTTKQTMTDYRAGLLEALPLHKNAMGNPARKQLNDCVGFGWAQKTGDQYFITAKGTAEIHAHRAR